jgi:hypothetical protein
MAHSTLTFENPHTGQIKQAPVGFSWTTFFFGAFPALFRGHWAGFLIMLICAIPTAGLSTLVMMFIYNKMYIKHLIGQGYKVRHATADIGYLQGKLGMELPLIGAKA